MRFQQFVEDQVFSPVLIADALRTTKSEIVGTLGLGRDAFSRASRIGVEYLFGLARTTRLQARIDREMLHARADAKATGGSARRFADFP